MDRGVLQPESGISRPLVRYQPRARARAWGMLLGSLCGVWLATSLAGGVPAWVWFASALAGSAALAVLALAPRLERGAWGSAGMLALVSLLLMGGWSALRLGTPRGDRLDLLVEPGAIVVIEGVVITPTERSDPSVVSPWRTPTERFEMRVNAVIREIGEVGELGKVSERIDATGVVGVSIPVEAADERAGQQPNRVTPGRAVRITGRFRPSTGATNPGEPDWSMLSGQRAHAGWISVPGRGLVELGKADTAWRGVLGWFVSARHNIRERAQRGIDADPTGVLSALVLGERDASFDETYRVFQRAGVAHVLAVSGFHLALLSGLAAWLVRATGERGRTEVLVVVCVAALMLVIVPARAPIVRAGFLVGALILSDAGGRRHDRLTILAWTAIALLVWRPADALGLGYLLSVGVTGVLIGLAQHDRRSRWSLLERARRLPRAGARRSHGALRWLGGAMRVNLSCWAAATPTIATSTGVVSLIAPIATLVMVPIAGLVLATGWAQACLSAAAPEAARHTEPIVVEIASWAGNLAAWLDTIPMSSLMITGVGWFWCAITTACVLAWIFVPARRRWFGSALLACVVWASVAHTRAGRIDGLRADMLDVGDGTCVLIRSGSEALLWDAGSLHRAVAPVIADAARTLGVTRVETAVVTHANADHFNALAQCAELLGIRRVLVTPALSVSRDGQWGLARTQLEAIGVEIVPLHAGDTVGLGRATGAVLHAGTGGDGLGNDGSLVVRFEIETDAGTRSLLMCGDLQTAGIAMMSARHPAIRADVIEVPHHGSANEAAVWLVHDASPTVVLQSTGPSRVGLPAWSPVRENTDWLSTAEGGAVFAQIQSDGRIDTGGFVPAAR